MAPPFDKTDLSEATVLARWGVDRALVRVPGGGVVTAAVPEHLRDDFDVGYRVTMAPGARLVSCEATPGRQHMPRVRRPARRRAARAAA